MDDLFGRTIIYTSVEEITSDNVIDVLNDAIDTHNTNVTQIKYLYEYYKGKQDILDRTKKIRQDINNKIAENRAKEIVDFKTAYLVGEPIQYSSRDTELTEEIDILNDYMRMEGKSTKDYALVEWQNIAGTAYRIVLPKTDEEMEEGDSPFSIETLDPRECFVIYSTGIGKKPIACVYFITDEEDNSTYWVYTKDKCFTIEDDEITETQDWTLGYLPIIEYPNNEARLGSFEVVIPLLNAINDIDSNRLDGIEQFIQAVLVLKNCRVQEGITSTDIAERGMLEIISETTNPADVEMLAQQLDQSQTQTLKNDLYDAVLTICSMPNRNGGTSTSDNGLAVIYRDGWTSAETAGKTSQQMIDKSELQMLKLVLRILANVGDVEIPIRAIKIDFTRNHYENLETKTLVLTQLLSNDKVNPLTAYEVCGLFADPNKKYIEGMKWFEEQSTNTKETEETEVTFEEVPEEIEENA